MSAAVEREGWQTIDEVAWSRLRAEFAEVSENTLRHDLREIGVPVDPLIEGVRLDSLEALERCLRALSSLYAKSIATKPDDTMNPARRMVLGARRKAEIVLRNPSVDAAKRTAMEEKFLWLRTWLENPAIFPVWVALRTKDPRNPEGSAVHLPEERNRA